MSDDVKRGADGRFAPGTAAGPGRKPGRPDIYALAERLARAEGFDLEGAIWLVVKAMLDRGQKGDTQAARLALDHLGLPAKQVLELQGSVEGPVLTQEEIERRVASLLATAQQRAAQAAAVGQNGANGKQQPRRAPDA